MQASFRRSCLTIAISIAALSLALTSFAAPGDPIISTLSPVSTVAGTATSMTLTVTGANFVTGARVRVNSVNRTTTFISSTQLSTILTSVDIGAAASLNISVANPTGTPTGQILFQVLPNSPTIATLTPTSVPVNSGAFILTVNGSNFAQGAVGRVSGLSRATTWIDTNTLSVSILASDITNPRTIDITVANPPSSSHISAAAQLTVTATAQPTITLVSPATAVALGPAFTVTIVGTNFVTTSFVRVNGLQRQTTFVDSTHLTAPITASDIRTAGNLTITVTNPGLLISNTVNLTVTSGNIPTIQSISPTSVVSGSSGATVAITGTNFLSTAIVRVDNADRPTTFVDDKHLTVRLPASDLFATGTRNITVFNPGQNGGTSSAVLFTIFDVNAPTISSLSPATVQVGTTNLNVTLTGTKFTRTDTVFVNGGPRTTAFLNSTQLVVTLNPSDVAAEGSLAITDVTTGGLSSSSITLNVTSSTGALISTLDPSFAAVGSGPFVLRVIGMNFFPQSIVTFDGVPQTTTFVSSLQLTVEVSTGDVASPRLIAVAVINPGGATSASANLTIGSVAPVILSGTPSSAIAGDSGFLLTLTGTGFTASSVVSVKGTARPTTFDATAHTLAVTLTDADLATPGPLQVTVSDTGGVSTAFSITVAGPVITGISPTLVQNPPANVTLTVTGSGFSANSKIVFKGTDRTTTFNAAAGTLTTTLTAADLSPGTYAVNVRNTPTALSAPAFLTVISPGQPNIDSLSPATATVGLASQSVTVTGINFVFGSTVDINGSPRPTQFVSSTALVVVLSADDLATAGTLTVTVVNPDASVSSSRTIVVSAAPPPGGSRRRGARH
jgi:hypothetical protein